MVTFSFNSVEFSEDIKRFGTKHVSRPPKTGAAEIPIFYQQKKRTQAGYLLAPPFASLSLAFPCFHRFRIPAVALFLGIRAGDLNQRTHHRKCSRAFPPGIKSRPWRVLETGGYWLNARPFHKHLHRHLGIRQPTSGRRHS
jgi:hypothetical protein